MKRSTKKLLGFVAAGFLAAVAIVPGLGTLKAGATPNYTPVTGTSMDFTKYLVIPADASVPTLTFSYTWATGTAVAGDADNMPIYAGTDTDRVSKKDDSKDLISIGTASFTSTDTGSATAGAEKDGITNSTEKKYAKKTVAIDFSNANYSEPGVYRYIITETATAGTTTAEAVRTVDVNVVDNNGALEVGSYVMYYGDPADFTSANQNKTTVQDTNKKANTQDDPDTQADETITAGDKCDNYVNVWPAQNLYIGKSIVGNQASKDKYFRYTVALTNAGNATHISVAGNYTTDELTSNVNGATTIVDTDIPTGETGYTNPATITTDANGAATVVFYLQGNQYVKLMGLPENAGYTVTEDSYVTDGYVTTATKPAAGTDPAVSFTITDGNDTFTFINATTGTIGTDDVLTGYINTKQGTIPTGVILSVAPWAIAGVVILAGVVFFAIRSRKKYEEE